MYVGAPTLCLHVKDLSKSIEFYEALGFSLRPGPEEALGVSAKLTQGTFAIFLMTFGSDSITFRGIDAFEIQQDLEAKGLNCLGDPLRQDDGGSQWLTEDPSGFKLFFNTHKHEMTPEFQQTKINQLLEDTEQNLRNLEASSECMNAYHEFLKTMK
jgi:catechol 2,3-dioxygenase-like lactoylglutathione lyase family enzyme